MKTRLDVLLVDQGYFQSREKAKAAIMAGQVFVDGQISDKAGNMIKEDANIEVKGAVCPYVSRGGFKLEKALKVFDIDVSGRICLDIGASTGGFTDVMLHNGARRVYAVDVGYGQLDYRLRNDERVVNMEKYNFRYAVPSDFPEPIEFAASDVSFISLRHIFPAAYTLLAEGGRIAFLVKPQFEAEREQVGKNGIIKDPKVHEEVLAKVCGYAADAGFTVKELSYSPVKGAKGNIEFLLSACKENQPDPAFPDMGYIKRTVEAAHTGLDI